MSDFRKGPQILVNLPNGHTYETNKVATMSLVVPSSTGPEVILLSDVIFVPAVETLLISVANLCDAGYKVSFGLSQCSIMTPTDASIKINRCPNRSIYYLPFSTVGNKQLNSLYRIKKSTIGHIIEAHRAFGHIGPVLLHQLSQSGLAPQCSCCQIEWILSRCNACQSSKAHANSPPEVTDHPASRIGK